VTSETDCNWDERHFSTTWQQRVKTEHRCFVCGFDMTVWMTFLPFEICYFFVLHWTTFKFVDVAGALKKEQQIVKSIKFTLTHIGREKQHSILAEHWTSIEMAVTCINIMSHSNSTTVVTFCRRQRSPFSNIIERDRSDKFYPVPFPVFEPFTIIFDFRRQQW